MCEHLLNEWALRDYWASRAAALWDVTMVITTPGSSTSNGQKQWTDPGWGWERNTVLYLFRVVTKCISWDTILFMICSIIQEVIRPWGLTLRFGAHFKEEMYEKTDNKFKDIPTHTTLVVLKRQDQRAVIYNQASDLSMPVGCCWASSPHLAVRLLYSPSIASSLLHSVLLAETEQMNAEQSPGFISLQKALCKQGQHTVT